jgi:hypothetical protein
MYRKGRCQLQARGMRRNRWRRARGSWGSTACGEPSAGRDGLVLDHFLGTVWHEDTGDVVDAVQALIEQATSIRSP